MFEDLVRDAGRFSLAKDDQPDIPEVADPLWHHGGEWVPTADYFTVWMKSTFSKIEFRASDFDVDVHAVRAQSWPQVLKLARQERTAAARLFRVLEDEQVKLSARVNVLEQQITERPLTKVVTIVDLNVPSLCIRQPVHVSLEIYADEVIASWPEVGAFASGISESEALLGLKQDIVDLANDLFSMDDVELGTLLLSQKRALETVVTRLGDA